MNEIFQHMPLEQQLKLIGHLGVYQSLSQPSLPAKLIQNSDQNKRNRRYFQGLLKNQSEGYSKRPHEEEDNQTGVE